MLLFLLFNNLGWGQSAQEINKQLKADLSRCVKKQDSITQLFKRKEYPLAIIKGETMHKLYILGREKDSTKELMEVTAQLKENLKMLGVDLKSLILTEETPVLPDYKLLTDPMQKIIKTHLDIGLPPLKPYYDNRIPLEEQNEVLKKEISENEYYLNYISSEYDQIKPQKNQLEQLAPKLDSMQIVYQSMRKELLVTKKKSEEKLKELRENYASKGPGGFSEAYKVVFPQVGQTIPIDKQIFEKLESEPEPDMRPSKKPELIIYEFTDEPAMFPEGNSAMIQYVDKNIRYPQIVIGQGALTPKQFVQFVVSERGSISNVMVKRNTSDCLECDAEIIRVIELMPKWIPAKINGKSVNSWHCLPINFIKK